jgi:hypothetical protein
VKEGFLNVNAEDFSVVVLCLDIPRCFLFTNSESAEGGSGRVSLVIKDVCDRSLGVGNVISGIYISSPYLGVGVLTSILIISFISFCSTSLCLGIGVFKFLVSMFLICI